MSDSGDPGSFPFLLHSYQWWLVVVVEMVGGRGSVWSFAPLSSTGTSHWAHLLGASRSSKTQTKTNRMFWDIFLLIWIILVTGEGGGVAPLCDNIRPVDGMLAPITMKNLYSIYVNIHMVF